MVVSTEYKSEGVSSVQRHIMRRRSATNSVKPHHVAFLPAYAPELNVVEQCWGHTKYGEMANFIPHDLSDLAQAVARSLLAKHQRPDLLRAFFQYAQLHL